MSDWCGSAILPWFQHNLVALQVAVPAFAVTNILIRRSAQLQLADGAP